MNCERYAQSSAVGPIRTTSQHSSSRRATARLPEAIAGAKIEAFRLPVPHQRHRATGAPEIDDTDGQRVYNPLHRDRTPPRELEVLPVAGPVVDVVLGGAAVDNDLERVDDRQMPPQIALRRQLLATRAGNQLQQLLATDGVNYQSVTQHLRSRQHLAAHNGANSLAGCAFLFTIKLWFCQNTPSRAWTTWAVLLYHISAIRQPYGDPDETPLPSVDVNTLQ